uniref:NADH-ubiquinone oxidoreductase chain 5 n=1 Tax=Paraplea frontalis TaxID=575836 RepID=A0A059T963_9HEMI|nr:NADH dehydrogenase subunit 5 [Paraplea frontalis]AHL44236.1 NADH dehydrogenase subunit 5 [Paraplea frontalis]
MRISFYSLSFFFLFFFGLGFFCVGLYFLKYSVLLLLDWELISINSCSMTMTFIFDWMSVLFVGCVFFISSMVIFYSGSYMSHDLYSVRFLYLVLLFVFSMFMMIISPNLISILIGWDGLGLVSYCLVIYFQNYKSYNAGMLTILTNRIGDVAILLSIAWMLNLGSWHFIYYVGFFDDWMYLFIMMVILAGFTKSAQIPFSSWLPAAMAAPTPVSALVHSSTLVTAGVYLLIRFSNLLVNIDCWFLFLLSMMTMFMSGIGACFEYDLKKIIALSTLSQLGLMMSLIFVGFSVISFFHLLTHAFFKALLFLCAGLIIHCMNNSQDIRHMGCVVNNLPFTCCCFCISNLSLCGIPFMSGFYSKDMMLEMYSMHGFNLFMYFVYYISIGLTVCYSTRLMYYLVVGYNNLYSCQSYFEDNKMTFSMIFLTIMSILGGSILSWLIFIVPNIILLSLILKIMALIFIFIGFFVGYQMSLYNFNNSFISLVYCLSYFLGYMWFMPNISTSFLSNYSMSFSNKVFNSIDLGWGEKFVSSSFLFLFNYLSKYNSYYQVNNIKLFMLSFFFIIIIFLI